jgi:antitoxin component YwqK of YwqJK toxin-antitoxin module
VEPDILFLTGKVPFKTRKIHGPWVSWYGNGLKKDEGNYVEEKQDGFWTRWYENGHREVFSKL